MNVYTRNKNNTVAELADKKIIAFEDKDELAQSNAKGAYWCEGCYSWQLPAGHELHIDNCDCNY